MLNELLHLEWFTTSPDAGTEECTCSVCGGVIGIDDGKGFAPIRVFDFNDRTELRFHQECWDELKSIVPEFDVTQHWQEEEEQ